MEFAPVVIVGAGPSGLAMSLSLAKYKVKSVILEKELEITTDPRAVYLNSDAVRILWDLGIREQLGEIGHVEKTLNFHRSTFQAKPFYTVDLSVDVLNQALPLGIAHAQPMLESALVNLVNQSDFCELRRGCTVESHEVQPDGMTIGYRNRQGVVDHIRCSWLIGADGKRGVVRKEFLESDAGIRQQEGKYKYEGTWVAANLKITPPTAQTHPKLPFWDLKMTPEEVCDLYWPKGWHFCTPPGKATACGLFGPYKERLWRHEFAEPHWNDSMDAITLFWEHIIPMITRDRTIQGTRFPDGPIAFPRDCIDVLRCRPFVFAQKCVNKWFDKRRILIGDSAHVFPPFGGEGMSSGLRDAHQLAWRIALVESKPSMSETAVTRLLTGWEAERQRGINDAITFTKINGMLCNEPESWGFFAFRHLQSLYNMLPVSLQSANPRTLKEAKGFKGAAGGFFLPKYDGGGKMAQVFVKSGNEHYRSDELLKGADSLLSLLILGADAEARYPEARNLLGDLRIPPGVLSEKAILALTQDEETSFVGDGHLKTFHPIDDRPHDVVGDISTYSSKPYLDRLGPLTRYAIIRPDFYIFALLKSSIELEACLHEISAMLE